MPTTRPRHNITESDALADALDAAEQRWPGESRARLLTRLALEGHRAAQRAVDDRVAALHRNAGVATGCYGQEYLAAEREGWPE
jgi:hypothetical protein